MAGARRVLVLGGTGWLGRRIAAAAIEAGDEVVCAARGVSGVPVAGSGFERVDRTDPDAYEALSGGEWDEVLELSWSPPFVAGALAALAERARHWTLVSSVSVYARVDEPGADESATTLPDDAPDRYGAAKAEAERRTTDAVGDRALVVRPGVIVGPGDPSDRFGYWPARLALARDQDVLVPSWAGRFVQGIDVDDLAAWIVRAGSAGESGAVNAVGPPWSLEDYLRLSAAVAGFGGRFVPASDELLRRCGVAPFAGPRSLPFWLPPESAGFLQRSNDAYLASGGTIRSLSASIERTLEDERQRGLGRSRNAGLPRDEELDILRRLADTDADITQPG